MPRWTPATLIERGGTAAQRLPDGTLVSVADHGVAWTQGGPALLLVGAGRLRGLSQKSLADRASGQPPPA